MWLPHGLLTRPAPWPSGQGPALSVPPGHARAGEPMELPAFAVDWLREAMAPGIREAGLFVARKNAKSAVLAVLLLSCLSRETAPCVVRGSGAVWRVPEPREKSGELWTQCQDIAMASGIEDVRFLKVPKRMVSWWGTVEFLSADKSAGTRGRATMLR